jgi:hypothetical protein
MLIAPDEKTGRIYAFDPAGKSRVIATSTLPVGGDIGVESADFVPPGFIARGGWVFVADRGTPGNPHPGTDSLLRLSARDLAAAGVLDGDLLLATEGGNAVEAVRCRSARCTVTRVADGPPTSHGEGHLVFVPGA